MKRPRRIRIQLVLCVFGVVVGAGVLAGNVLGMGQAGFGEADLTILGIALGIVLLGALPWTTCLGLGYAKVFTVCASIYITLIIGDQIIYRQTRPPSGIRNPIPGLQGLYQIDKGIDYSLTPNWEGYWDDGIVRARIKINTEGHRDKEFGEHAQAETVILLGGDSYAFGLLLKNDETIDSHVERLSDGRIAAYNLGVPGYGSPHVLESFRRAQSYNASAFIYVFYTNDLRDDALTLGYYTVFDGYQVRRYPPDEMRARIARSKGRTQRGRTAARVRDAIRLSQVRQRLSALLEPEFATLGPQTERYKQGNVLPVVETVRRMRILADARGMQFYVLIIPSVGEVRQRRYSSIVRTLVEALRAEQILLIEILRDARTSDYFLHDGHYNTGGALRAGRAILNALKPSLDGSIESLYSNQNFNGRED